jgi:hypothetical protein
MSLRNAGLKKAFLAGAAIAANRLIKFGTDDRTMIPAAAAGDSIVGVSDEVGCASGERFDAVLTGIATVDFGGTITRGTLITSDSVGRAITATATAGTNIRTCGIALASGVLGDKGPVLLIPGSFQG